MISNTVVKTGLAGLLGIALCTGAAATAQAAPATTGQATSAEGVSQYEELAQLHDSTVPALDEKLDELRESIRSTTIPLSLSAQNDVERLIQRAEDASFQAGIFVAKLSHKRGTPLTEAQLDKEFVEIERYQAVIDNLGWVSENLWPWTDPAE